MRAGLIDNAEKKKPRKFNLGIPLPGAKRQQNGHSPQRSSPQLIAPNKAAALIGLAWMGHLGNALLFSPLRSARPLAHHEWSRWLSRAADAAVALLLVCTFFIQRAWMVNNPDWTTDLYPVWLGPSYYLSAGVGQWVLAAAVSVILADISFKKYLLGSRFWHPESGDKEEILPYYVQWAAASFLLITSALNLAGLEFGGKMVFVDTATIVVFASRTKTVFDYWLLTFKIIWKVKDMIMVLFVYVALSALIQYFVESHDDDSEGLWEQFLSDTWKFFAALSTANFPDIMLDLYVENRMYCLLYISYITIGCLILMNLVLATVIQLFQEHVKRHGAKHSETQARHLEAAFRTLAGDDEEGGGGGGGGGDAGGGGGPAAAAGAKPPGGAAGGRQFVAWGELRALFYEMGRLRLVTPSSVRKFVAAGEQAMAELAASPSAGEEGKRSGAAAAGAIVAPDAAAGGGGGGEGAGQGAGGPAPVAGGFLLHPQDADETPIDPDTFEECVGLLLASMYLRPRKTEVEKWAPTLYSTQTWSTLRYMVTQLYLSKGSFLEQIFGRAKVFEMLIDLVCVVNMVLLILFTAQCDGIDFHSSGSRCIIFIQLEVLFLILYDTELLLKIACYGWQRFISSPLNTFDMLTIFCYNIAVIATNLFTSDEEVEQISLPILSLMRLFRVFRIFYSFKKSRMLIKKVISLGQDARPLLILIFSYIFIMASLGVNVFGGCIRYDSFTEGKGTTDYALYGYYPFNFNDMFSAVVLVFVLLQVNEWVLFVNAFTVTTGSKWARFYFAINYLLGVLVVVNMFLAFIINSLISLSRTEKQRKVVNLIAKSESAVDLTAHETSTLESLYQDMGTGLEFNHMDGECSLNRNSISVLQWAAKDPRGATFRFGPFVSKIKEVLQRDRN